MLKSIPSFWRKPFHPTTERVNVANFLELLEGLLIAAKLGDGNHFIPSLLPDLSKEKVSEHRVTSSDHSASLCYPLPQHVAASWSNAFSCCASDE